MAAPMFHDDAQYVAEINEPMYAVSLRFDDTDDPYADAAPTGWFRRLNDARRWAKVRLLELPKPYVAREGDGAIAAWNARIERGRWIEEYGPASMWKLQWEYDEDWEGVFYTQTIPRAVLAESDAITAEQRARDEERRAIMRAKIEAWQAEHPGERTVPYEVYARV